MTEAVTAEYELPVRITLRNDQAVDATIFPLQSHKHDAPIDTLAGFLNKRRHDFFVVRQPDDSEMLLPLRHCLVFELMHSSVEMLRAIHQDMSALEMTTNPRSVVSYAPVILTLINSRIVRGDLWFYEFEPEEERNVAAGLNRESRYLCLHGDKSTLFVRRADVMKAQLQSAAAAGRAIATSHPEHVTQTSGLIDVTEIRPIAPFPASAVAEREVAEEPLQGAPAQRESDRPAAVTPKYNPPKPFSPAINSSSSGLFQRLPSAPPPRVPEGTPTLISPAASLPPPPPPPASQEPATVRVLPGIWANLPPPPPATSVPLTDKSRKIVPPRSGLPPPPPTEPPEDPDPSATQPGRNQGIDERFWY